MQECLSPLELAFHWPLITVRAFIDILGVNHLRQSTLCTATATTSFFSGIGTSELAWKAIAAALAQFGVHCCLRQTFACEHDPVCQVLLLAHTSGHIFADLLDMMSAPGLIGCSSFEQKHAATRSAAVRLSAWCCRHGARCPVSGGDIDTSGSPCQDWSTAGLRRGSEGERVHLLLLWMRWHRVMETPIIIHENVKGFDLKMLTTFLGDLYVAWHVEVGPEHVGWPCCKRPRLYVALLHRRKVRLHCDPVHLFWLVSSKLPASLRVRDCLIASAAEIQYEIGKRSRPSAAAVRGMRLAAAAPRQLIPESQLTSYERVRSLNYASLWRHRYGTEAHTERDLIFNLGDNPCGGWLTWSAPSTGAIHRVPTFRRHWTAQWLPHQQRWLTSNERLVCMGFPAHPGLAVCYGMSETYCLTWEQRHTLGNAMHVANIGVWQACIAASTSLMQGAA